MKNILYINKIIKQVRSKVIKEHLNKLNINKCVCFTCGNASKYLKDTGLHILSIGEKEELKPNKWFTYTDIQRKFNMFDATSGHLPMPLINIISKQIHDLLKPLLNNIDTNTITYIPTGSGESLIIMCMAFPDYKFESIRFSTKETEYNKDAPLNNIVMYIDNQNHI